MVGDRRRQMGDDPGQAGHAQNYGQAEPPSSGSVWWRAPPMVRSRVSREVEGFRWGCASNAGSIRRSASRRPSGTFPRGHEVPEQNRTGHTRPVPASPPFTEGN